MSMNARRTILGFPSYQIDRTGQVYRVDGDRAVRVPCDADGRVKITLDHRVVLLNLAEALAHAFPEEPLITPVVVAEPEPLPPDPEPEVPGVEVEGDRVGRRRKKRK
jgi:hypothetical protein